MRLRAVYAVLLLAAFALHAQDPSNVPAHPGGSIAGRASARPARQESTKTWIDKSTGHRVYRLTDEPNSGAPYFNINATTPDGKYMVYTSSKGIHVLDFATKRRAWSCPRPRTSSWSATKRRASSSPGLIPLQESRPSSQPTSPPARSESSSICPPAVPSLPSMPTKPSPPALTSRATPAKSSIARKPPLKPPSAPPPKQHTPKSKALPTSSQPSSTR